MFRLSVFLALLVLVSVFGAVPKRLIELNETTRVWMTEEEMIQQGLGECGAGKQSFIDVTDFPNLRPAAWQKPSELPTQLRMQSIVRNLTQRVSQDGLKFSVDTLTNFGTRYYTTQPAVAAAAWIKSEFERMANPRLPFSASFFTHSWQQPSVIATITGTDPTAPVVVIGSHEDSTNPSNNNNAPGSDDDASGVATVLEIFRTLNSDDSFRPRRTVHFMCFAAEEVGLRGSQEIAASFQSRGVPVYGMLQLDMTMWVGASGRIGVVTDFTDARQNVIIRGLIDEYTNIGWRDTTCGYGCSDHASWTRAGYPSSFTFEAPFGEHNPNIHTTRDTTAVLSFTHGAEFVKLGIAFALEMSA